MAREDILLTADGDIALDENGEISFTTDIRQAISIRLKWFLGEWRINPAYGVDYFNQIFVKNAQKEIITSRISEAILDVDGVESLNYIDVDFDDATRVATVEYSVTVDEESYEGSVEVIV